MRTGFLKLRKIAYFWQFCAETLCRFVDGLRYCRLQAVGLSVVSESSFEVGMHRHQFAILALFVIGLCVSGSLGCGSAVPTSDPLKEAHLKVLGKLYGKFLSRSRGQAPASQEQFVEYLNSKPANWDKIVSSADQLLLSPYDQEPLVVFYGAEYDKQNRNNSIWMAYERVGSEGTHRLISIRGTTEQKTSDEVQQLFEN